MDTTELKSNLYELIRKTKDFDILYAVTILLEKQHKINKIDDLQTEYNLSEGHKKILDERYESYKKNPKDVVSWENVRELIKNS